ncbi:hypothetical protein E2C01_048754 [Portunus trituberculatus]|uniref:Uncharacterized protein n=1 Tax=Portunus trituberculatus TaxID=210409 RepID=A0A5B7GBU5_PORTR|nr:hypothetical protein [Portunus trituberculatus]
MHAAVGLASLRRGNIESKLPSRMLLLTPQLFPELTTRWRGVVEVSRASANCLVAGRGGGSLVPPASSILIDRLHLPPLASAASAASSPLAPLDASTPSRTHIIRLVTFKDSNHKLGHLHTHNL